MNKKHFLTLSGLFLITAGIVLIFSKDIGIHNSKIVVPISFVLSGILSILFSKYNQVNKIAKQFHLIQGIGLIIFAVIIAITPNSLTSFLSITTYFILVFGLIEITFMFSVLNSKSKLNKSILLTRLAIGGLNLIGGFILMLTLFKDAISAVTIAGILIALGGINMIWFSRKI